MVQFSGFQQLLFRKFLYERHWRVDEIAQKLNVGRSTMYRWIDGEAHFPVDLVGMLTIVTGDRDFIDFVLQGTGYTLAPLPTPEVEVGRVEAETLDVAREAGKFVGVVQQTLRDGHIDRKDIESICSAGRDLQREVEEVRVAAEGTARPGLRVAK